jgi:hypothetical protein
VSQAVNEAKTIQLTLHEMGDKLLPQYEADDGRLKDSLSATDQKARSAKREEISAF